MADKDIENVAKWYTSIKVTIELFEINQDLSIKYQFTSYSLPDTLCSNLNQLHVYTIRRQL